MNRFYYSLIQFNADPTKQEVLNIGVLLFDTSDGKVRFKTTNNFNRLKRVFKETNYKFLGISLEDFVANVGKRFSGRPSIEAVEEFRGLRANNIRMTTLRPTFADDPKAELLRLFRELVDEEPSSKRRSPVASKMRAELKRQNVLQYFDKNPEPVPIPRYEEFVLKPDLALRREHFELIAPARFDEADIGLEQAGKMRLAGAALHKTQTMRLIVVGDFGNQADGFYNAIKEDLVAANTKLFRLEELEHLASRVAVH